MSDWDTIADLVNTSIRDVFGEAITYTPKGLAAVAITAVHDEAHASVQVQGELAITTTRPALTVRLADLAVTPQAGDTYIRAIGAQYEIEDVQIEGQGTAKLLALRKA